jgi:ribosome-associated protein
VTFTPRPFLALPDDRAPAMRYTSLMIRITPAISIDEAELSESFMRSSGPGGQNVNKVSTAVELRFNAVASPNRIRIAARSATGRRC